MIFYERNLFNGKEVRQEEHDTLPKMRQEDLQLKEGKMRILRLWKKRKEKGLQVHEEVCQEINFLEYFQNRMLSLGC